ncbi:hypothetical protein TNCV_3530741, partial [Trichonephila clavipes]
KALPNYGGILTPPNKSDSVITVGVIYGNTALAVNPQNRNIISSPTVFMFIKYNFKEPFTSRSISISNHTQV